MEPVIHQIQQMEGLIEVMEELLEWNGEAVRRYVDRELRRRCGITTAVPEGVPINHATMQLAYPSLQELRELYPDEHGDLVANFREDINIIVSALIREYGCLYFREHLNQLDLLEFLEAFLQYLHQEYLNNTSNRGGAKYKYKGRSYVVRRGARCGKYILVKGKKVYLSQI